MPCSISENQRERIEVKIELSQPSNQIAKDIHVSRRVVQRFTKNLRDYGTIKPPKVVPQGRPRSITPEMEEVQLQILKSTSRNINLKALLDYLAARPSTYIDEQVYFLWDTFDVQVNEQCIKRMLKRVKWSKKKVLFSFVIIEILIEILTSRCKYELHNKTPNSGGCG